MAFDIDKLVAKAISVVADQTAIINQVWAAELEYNLRKRAVLQQSIVENTDLLGTSGDKVYVPTLPDLTAAATLTEGTDMTPVALTAATNVALTPTEVGKSVSITRKALDRIKYDGMAAIVDRLAYAFSLYIEGAIAGLWNADVPGTANAMAVQCPNGHTSANVVNTDTFSNNTILDAVATLESTDNIPFPDGFWRLYIHPNQYKALMKDQDTRQDLRFASPQVVLRGEVGMLHNCRIIKSTHLKQVTENGITTYKALLLAPRWAAVAWKRRPEVMVDPTVYDFGRRRQFGVTADLDIELLHNDRAICITTA